MVINLRKMAFATLWKKYEKKLITNAVKEAVRKGFAEVINEDYCTITLDNYTTSKYSAEDQAKIDKFIADNHIEKITEKKANYSIEFVPTEKAIKEFDEMIDKMTQSSNNVIAKRVAAKVANTNK